MAAFFMFWSLVILFLHFYRFPVPLENLPRILSDMAASRFWNPYALRALGSIGLAFWVGWVSFEVGDVLLGRVDAKAVWSSWERGVFGSGLGLGALAYFVFFAGLLHLWYLSFFGVVLAALSLIFVPRRLRRKRGTDETIWKFAGWGKVWIALLAASLLLILLGDLTPEIFFDSLYYHLAVPNLYGMSHQIYALPTLLFSNFVLTLQWLYGLADTLGGALTAKLLHGWMALLLACSFLCFARRFLSRDSGPIAAVLFFTLPLVGINAITTGIDVGFSFLFFLSAYALVAALTDPRREAFRLAGLLTGLAAGCKYPGLPFIPIACLVIVWHQRRDERRSWGSIRGSLYDFTAPAVLVLLPLVLRNVLFHHNPLYPFGGTVWGTPRILPHHWRTFVLDAGSPALSAEFAGIRAFTHYVLQPWFQVMNARVDRDFVQPILYLVFVPLLFLRRSSSLAYLTFRRYTLLLWVVWMLTASNFRYAFPAFALLSALIAEAAVALAESGKIKAWVFGLIVLLGASDVCRFMKILYDQGGWRVLGGLTTADAYLNEAHPSYPTPPYEGIAWMNQNLPPGSKVLFVGEARSYYAKFPVVVSSAPDPQPIVEYARQARSGEDMAARMRGEQITALYINFAEVIRTQNYGAFAGDQASWNVFRDFMRHQTKLLWKTEHFEPSNPKAQYIYELLSPEQAARPHPAPVNPFERPS